MIGELLRQFDPSYGERGPNLHAGGRVELRPLRALARAAPASPRGPASTAARSIWSSDAFRLMYHVPGVEGLHALRDSIGFIAKARLPIGRDGRNRPSLFPFGTATGRNAHARSPYNCSRRSARVHPVPGRRDRRLSRFSHAKKSASQRRSPAMSC